MPRINCPECGGDTLYPCDEDDKMYCIYCGKKISLKTEEKNNA